MGVANLLTSDLLQTLVTINSLRADFDKNVAELNCRIQELIIEHQKTTAVCLQGSLDEILSLERLLKVPICLVMDQIDENEDCRNEMGQVLTGELDEYYQSWDNLQNVLDDNASSTREGFTLEFSLLGQIYIPK